MYRKLQAFDPIRSHISSAAIRVMQLLKTFQRTTSSKKRILQQEEFTQLKKLSYVPNTLQQLGLR